MTLKKYRAKRDFTQTSEPSSSSKHPPNALSFCIQKHAARRLHFDFRLEHRGVLISWAVPKGPSLNPKDKRLAVKVEDHPLDYQYFEGVIPKGSYGAGTVEIWDKGFYTLPGVDNREEIEKTVAKGLKIGHLAIILHGEKLNGEFILQKLKKDSDDNSWLLIKKKDEHSSLEDDPTPAKRKKMPHFIPPMLATLIDKPFTDDNWLFEIKWDGFRALAFVDGDKVFIKSRSNQILNQRFPDIIHDLEKMTEQVILDGEIVVLDEKGKSDFQLIQNYQKKKGALYYYVFDILYKNGKNLCELPLIERKEILKQFLDPLSLPHIHLSRHILKKGEAFFKEISKMHLEGIIGKNMTSTYQSKRSLDWVKVKTGLNQEVVIGGFTEPRGSRKYFGALLVGIYDKNKQLKYAGHVGGGFDQATLHAVFTRLKPLIQSKCPFKIKPKGNEKVTWVKPQLLAEVSFAEWTQENIMRQPIFKGLRTDKPSKTVKKEVPIKTENEASNSFFTNLDKIYWPKEKYTKGDLIHYYESIASFILPYLKKRPIMLHRFPNGINGEDFYQKDLAAKHPAWIKTYAVQHEGKCDHYLAIDDTSSLLYAVNLGSIDLHPFLSQYKKLEYPDFCLIDLDPHGVNFDTVIEIALTFHEIFEQIGIKHYCKTSGGNGLHIVIPLHGKYTYEQSRQFAEMTAHCVHQKFPKETSLERSPKKRAKKIYIDCLQNRIGQTMVAPYSVRPRPNALVSTPLDWNEVKKGVSPTDFSIKNISARLKKKGDLWQGVLGPGISIVQALKKLKKLYDFN